MHGRSIVIGFGPGACVEAILAMRKAMASP
jgi:hypothetical protein